MTVAGRLIDLCTGRDEVAPAFDTPLTGSALEYCEAVGFDRVIFSLPALPTLRDIRALIESDGVVGLLVPPSLVADHGLDAFKDRIWPYGVWSFPGEADAVVVLGGREAVSGKAMLGMMLRGRFSLHYHVRGAWAPLFLPTVFARVLSVVPCALSWARK